MQGGQDQQQERIYLTTDGLTSPSTKRAYYLSFNQFIKTTVKNDNLRALLDTKQNVIESKIIDHITYLNEVQHLSCVSIQTHLSGILRFFSMNDYHINTKKIRRFLPEDIVSEDAPRDSDRPYSAAEIQQILSRCDIRARAAVLIMTSTGCRIDALRELRYGDITKITEFGLYRIWMYNRYRKHRYLTFCTPECAAAIDEYLDYRQKFGEKIEDKSPLIRERFDIMNPFIVQAPKFLSKRSMSLLFEDSLKRSGVNQIKPGHKRREVRTSHGFRKFYINQSEKANINYTTWKCLVGHKLRKVDAAYKRTTEEDMLAEYVKAISLLTFDPNETLREKVKELESERLKTIDEYHDEWLNKLKQEYSLIPVSEWNALKNEINQIKELLPNDFDQFMKYRAQNKNIGLKVRYVSAIPDPEKKRLEINF